MTATPAVLHVSDLSKHYGATPVFAQVSFAVQPGEFVAIVGDSGVGKSTVLNCLAGLDDWDHGRILHGDTDLARLDDTQRALWRRAHVGFVFQAFHVLPHLDVAQNVALPLMLLGQHDPARVQQMLEAVGLGDLGARLPQQLSGGQLQRVAIARALVHRPALLLADEPTGNLDPGTAQRTLDDRQRALWRRAHVGFVFQAFHVLPHLDVAQNVGLPLLLLGLPDPAHVADMLRAVGLEGLGERLPQQLSGGQLQRVAIARAVVHSPQLLLADEPTGNLDPSTAQQVMDLLLQQTRDNGTALILVTHSADAAKRADRVLRLTASGMQAEPAP